MMDEILGLLAAAVFLVLTISGGVFLVSDVRHFQRVVADCKEQGYIQNEKIRVLCSIEEKK